LGVGCILPPDGDEGYPSPKGPSHPYVRRILKNTNVDTPLEMLSICRDWDSGGGRLARKEGTFEPSHDGGCSKDAAEEMNLGRI